MRPSQIHKRLHLTAQTASERHPISIQEFFLDVHFFQKEIVKTSATDTVRRGRLSVPGLPQVLVLGEPNVCSRVFRAGSGRGGVRGGVWGCARGRGGYLTGARVCRRTSVLRGVLGEEMEQGGCYVRVFGGGGGGGGRCYCRLGACRLGLY